MISRALGDLGNIVLVLALTAVPGSLIVAFLLPSGNLAGFLLGMLFLMPLASAGLALATPILVIMTLLGHRSWWSRICVAICAGAALALIMLYEISPDPRQAFDLPGVFRSAGVGAVSGLWAGAWWCFLFHGRAEQLAGPR